MNQKLYQYDINGGRHWFNYQVATTLEVREQVLSIVNKQMKKAGLPEFADIKELKSYIKKVRGEQEGEK
jgi:hypothetical protein